MGFDINEEENAPQTEKPGAFNVSGAVESTKKFLGDKFNSLSRLGEQYLPASLRKKPVEPTSVELKSPQGIPIEDDWRVRLALPTKLEAEFLSYPLLNPLLETLGVVFPYTPQIQVIYAAHWNGQNPTHSNYTQHFYERSEVQDINISGVFTATNSTEGAYLLAVITFVKLFTKMFYGSNEPNNTYVGHPPPVMRLYGYGAYQWNGVPVVLKNAQYTLPQDVDYITVPTPAGSRTGVDGEVPISKNTRVPVELQVQFTVAPVYSRKQMAEFDYSKFASGELITKGYM